MKNIQLLLPQKDDCKFLDGNDVGIYCRNNNYCLSLEFEQEIDLGEGINAADISQYPLEDVLDKYTVYISDSYPKLNTPASQKCYLEFASGKIENVRKLKDIIGKHVYNKTVLIDGKQSVQLKVE